MSDLTLLGLCGSLRADSYNRKLMHAAAQSFGPSSFVEGDLNLPLFNEDVEAQGMPDAVTRLKEQVKAADAVVIACPEYNKAPPGALKNALDWLSRGGQPWTDKPVAMVSATAGRAGGERTQFALRLMMVAFRPQLLHGAGSAAGRPQGPFRRKRRACDRKLPDAFGPTSWAALRAAAEARRLRRANPARTAPSASVPRPCGSCRARRRSGVARNGDMPLRACPNTRRKWRQTPCHPTSHKTAGRRHRARDSAGLTGCTAMSGGMSGKKRLEQGGLERQHQVLSVLVPSGKNTNRCPRAALPPATRLRPRVAPVAADEHVPPYAPKARYRASPRPLPWPRTAPGRCHGVQKARKYPAMTHGWQPMRPAPSTPAHCDHAIR